MPRWPLIFGVAVFVIVGSLGVHTFLRDQHPPELLESRTRASNSGQAAASELASLAALAPTTLAAIPDAPETPAALANPDAKQRTSSTFDTVTLFERGLYVENFALGERWEVGLGLTNTGSAFGNDRVRAVQIPTGLQATLFDDADGQGFKLTLGPGTHDLAALAFSARTSSILVARYGQAADEGGPEDAVVLYEHRAADLGGRGLAWRLELPRGEDQHTFRASRGAFLDDQASTAWIPQGFELVLFAELDARGIALVLGPGLHELELLGFNDRASSAMVRRVR